MHALRVRLVVRLALLLAPCAVCGAQTYRLSPDSPRERTLGYVRDFRVHPAGTQVLFRVDASRPGVLELQRAPIDGGAHPLTVVHLPLWGAVTSYEFDATGQWLVYLADRDREGHVEVFSHQVGTNGSVRLCAAGLAGSVSSFRISPDGQRVFYLADADVRGEPHLFSARIDGSQLSVRLDPPLAPSTILPEFSLAPLGDRVAIWNSAGSGGLWSSPADGSTPPVQLDAGAIEQARFTADGAQVVYRRAYSGLARVSATGASGPVSVADDLAPVAVSFALTADGQRVVYLASAVVNETEVFSAPLDGSASAVQISPPVVGDHSVSALLLASDSVRAVFVEQSDQVRLYSARVDGSGAPVLLEQPQRRPLGWLTLAPDGRRAVYYRYGIIDLRSVPIDGSAPAVRLDDTGGVPAVVNSPSAPFVISPDSRSVLYVWGQPSSGLGGQGLYVVPIDRSASPTQLAAGGANYGFAFDPGSTRAVFTLAHFGVTVAELYSEPLVGGTPVKLSAELARGAATVVSGFATTGADVLFATSSSDFLDPDQSIQRTRADGSMAPLALVGPEPVTLSPPAVSPDGAWAAYLHAAPDGQEIWSVPTDASRAPSRLATSVAYGWIQDDIQITGDSARVVYRREGLNEIFRELWSVPLSGATAPVELATGDIASCVLTPDGRRAIYARNYPRSELFSVPVDGSGAPASLSLADVHPYVHVTPDGQRVLFSRRNSGATTCELCSAPTDGGFALVVLSSSQVSDFALAPDGQRVAFIEQTGTALDLYSAAALGGSAPVHLAGPVDAGSVVAVSPDSTRVVYELARRLLVVPIDGSAAPRELSGPMVPGGGVRTTHYRRELAFTPDGTRVLYVADQRTLGTYELFGAPTDASTPPVALSGDLGPDADVLTDQTGRAFRVSADSSWVVYLADRRQDGVAELYLVPAAPGPGGVRPILLDAGLAAPGCRSFEIAADSARVLYLAGRRAYETELFASLFPAIPVDRHVQRR